MHYSRIVGFIRKRTIMSSFLSENTFKDKKRGKKKQKIKLNRQIFLSLENSFKIKLEKPNNEGVFLKSKENYNVYIFKQLSSSKLSTTKIFKDLIDTKLNV